MNEQKIKRFNLGRDEGIRAIFTYQKSYFKKGEALSLSSSREMTQDQRTFQERFGPTIRKHLLSHRAVYN